MATAFGKNQRRRIFSGALLIAVAVCAAPPASAQAAEAETVRDRLWVFSCPTNSDFPHIGRRSVVSPAEGAFYLGVPNILMVQASERESPYGRLEPPFEQYTVALRPLKRVVWSVVGSGGFHKAEETAEVLAMANRVANFRGVMLDDFFTGNTEGKRAQWSVEELAELRGKLNQTGKKLDIYVTFYVRHFDLPLADYLDQIDVLTYWNMDSGGIRDLEDNLQKLERLYPRKRKMLGCYVVDYRNKRGMPVDLMKHQCEVGLRWLQAGRIEGIIFLGNTVLDLGFESAEWTRQWIQQVGDTELN
ncbi:MAG: hypothetical protein ACOX1P_26170 [Thermoguttaceae bacterium]|jgi:hypothetical protein